MKNYNISIEQFKMNKLVTEYNVLKSWDYHLFKTIRGNRAFNPPHLQNLIQSMKKKHYVSPILVNENMEILDGQNRFWACKELGLPIYFIVILGGDFDESMEAVITLNADQKAWSRNDYLHSFAERDYPDYVQLREFMSIPRFKHFGPMTSGEICAGDEVKYQDFKKGKYNFSTMKQAIDFGDKILDFDKNFKKAKTTLFVRTCLAHLFKNPNYDHERMMYKISLGQKIEPRDTIRDYILQLQDIYNYMERKNGPNWVQLYDGKSK